MRGEDNLNRERSFPQIRRCSRQPGSRLHAKPNSTLGVEKQDFPNADGREPKFIFLLAQFVAKAATQAGGLQHAPKPYVCIKEQPQSRRASQSVSSITGEIMSPTISAVPAIEPNQSPRSPAGEGGPISATGLPKRVTRIGFLVLRTRSSMARHLALNTDMATSSMTSPLIQRLYHSQSIWSICDKQGGPQRRKEILLFF